MGNCFFFFNKLDHILKSRTLRKQHYKYSKLTMMNYMYYPKLFWGKKISKVWEELYKINYLLLDYDT